VTARDPLDIVGDEVGPDRFGVGGGRCDGSDCVGVGVLVVLDPRWTAGHPRSSDGDRRSTQVGDRP
jgi:hypothetical protein